MRLALICTALVLLLFTSGCRKPAPAIEPSATAAPKLPQVYEPLFNGGRLPGRDEFAWQENVERWRAQFPFESITLERSPCYGSCPVYRFSMNRNGHAELEAIKYLPALGKFAGEVDAGDYGRLCYLLEQLHFMTFAPAYEADWTDDATCTITTTGTDHEKSVREYGSVGPIELWAIQQTIENIRQKTEWKPR